MAYSTKGPNEIEIVNFLVSIATLMVLYSILNRSIQNEAFYMSTPVIKDILP